MILHVSHNDMDGVACAILTRKVYGNKVEHVHLNYDIIDDFLMENYQHYDQIIISDVYPSKHIVAQLSSEIQLQIFDHHLSSLQLKEFPFMHHESDRCATNIMYDWFSANGYKKEMAPYEEFVRLVNDYDLWLLKDENSRRLNILYSMFDNEKFFNRFVNNPSVEFSEAESMIVTTEEERVLKVAQKTYKSVQSFTDTKGRRFAFAFNTGYTTETGHYILEQGDHDYVILVNPQTNKASLRSLRHIDCSDMAVANGGGGHKNACAFSFDFDFGVEFFLRDHHIID